MRIVLPRYRTRLELHLVFCQSACFVGEDVLDLTQILGDVQGPALYPLVSGLVVEIKILVDEVDL